MKKLILKIAAAVLAVAALTVGGVYFYQNYDSGEQIIFVEAAADPNAPVDMYVELTDAQIKTIKKRAEKNMLRVAGNGAPLTEVEAREIFNYIVAIAAKRYDVKIEGIWIGSGLKEQVGADAICYPRFDSENNIATPLIAVDLNAYEAAKSSATSLIRLLFVLTHEVGHGLEPAAANDPTSLMGLVYNLYYDACKTIPEFIENKSLTDIQEMVADVFACSVMLDEFDFVLEKVKFEALGVTFKWQYESLFNTRNQQLLMAVLPGMDNVYGKTQEIDAMITPLTDAYAAGEIAPSEAVAKIFDRGGGKNGVPSFEEFIKLMDETYGIGEIDSLYNEEELNGVSVQSLKQFVLSAPFLIGIPDVPYSSYEKYLTDLYAERDDFMRILDMDRIWAGKWAAEISNGEFAKIIDPYLK